MSELYYDLEVPLSKVLAICKIRGIRVMTGRLVEMEEEIDGQLKEIQLRIFELAGEEFNINSPKQLGVVLFEKLELPVIKDEDRLFHCGGCTRGAA